VNKIQNCQLVEVRFNFDIHQQRRIVVVFVELKQSKVLLADSFQLCELIYECNFVFRLSNVF
jgi:hypothetical protein